MISGAFFASIFAWVNRLEHDVSYMRLHGCHELEIELKNEFTDFPQRGNNRALLLLRPR